MSGDAWAFTMRVEQCALTVTSHLDGDHNVACVLEAPRVSCEGTVSTLPVLLLYIK